jgi:nucleoside diphosphate kinase
LVGEIIRRFEARGYKLVGIKFLHPTLQQAKEHYFDLRYGSPVVVWFVVVVVWLCTNTACWDAS